MNKRKTAQAARTNSRGRKRVMKAMRGGRVVVVTPEKGALLALMRPQLPIKVAQRMKAQLAAVEAANAAAGLTPTTPPVIDLNAPYTPGKSTIDIIGEPEPLVVVPPKEHTHARERARRLRQASRAA